MPVSKNHKKKPRRKAPPRPPIKKAVPDPDKHLAQRPSLSKLLTQRATPDFKTAMQHLGLADPVDYTKNGKCSRCGGCCASILPISEKEKKALQDYVNTYRIKAELPDEPAVVADLQCPFLDREARTCRIYDIRPNACKAFICSNTTLQNSAAYAAHEAEGNKTEPFNMWELFGKTGLRAEDGEITPENAARATLIGDDGKKHPVQAGKPISLTTKVGMRINNGMLIAIGYDTLRIFNGQDIVTIPAKDIVKLD